MARAWHTCEAPASVFPAGQSGPAGGLASSQLISTAVLGCEEERRDRRKRKRERGACFQC